MKKALVATCVVAMTVFTITNASADPVGSARANAYGINVAGSLLDELVEREPEVTSVLPPGGLVSEDIITPDADPVTIAGTGVVVAETSVESTIVPFLGAGEGGTTGGGTTGGGTTGDALLGGIFDDLLGGGGGGGGGLGVLSEDGGAVEAQQLDGLTGGGDEGLLGGTLGGDLLGGLLDGGDGSDDVGADDEIVIPAVNARGFVRIEDLNIVIEDSGTGLGSLPTEIQALLVDALLEIDAVTSEAVAVCVDDQVFFDTASNIVALNDEPVTLIDDLLDTVSELTEDLGLLEIVTNEVGVTDDGTGVFVNALHITVLDDLLGDVTGGDTVGGDTVGDAVPVVPGAEAGQVEAQQLGDGGDEPLLDIIIGHSEVSAISCAAAPPAPPTSLTPTGDARPSLPVTGGGLGALPLIAGVGLLGGALTAGRLALRSRRNDSV